MGRPPKRKSDKRTECVMARLTPGERRELERDAEAEGLPAATFIVRCWRKATGRD